MGEPSFADWINALRIPDRPQGSLPGQAALHLWKRPAGIWAGGTSDPVADNAVTRPSASGEHAAAGVTEPIHPGQQRQLSVPGNRDSVRFRFPAERSSLAAHRPTRHLPRPQAFANHLRER